MTIDMTKGIEGNTDQLNAANLTGRSVVVQILAVRNSRGQADKEKQPYEVVISDFKPWRPCLTSRRILIELWGDDGDKWVGHWVRLYNDETVRNPQGGEPGGIRMDAADLDKPFTTKPIIVSRGKTQRFTIKTIQPPKPPTLEDLLASRGLTVADLDAYREKAGKGPISSLTEEQVAKMVSIYRASPEKLDEVRR
jgi:hypothetical protein